MTTSDDIVVLADVRSKLTAARPSKLTIVDTKPVDPSKPCTVLMFTGVTISTVEKKP